VPNQLTHTENKSQFSPAAVHNAALGNEGNRLFEKEPPADLAISEKPINGLSKSGSPSDSGNGDESSNSTRLFNYLRIQPKLTVGQPGGKYGQEADRAAETVIRRPKEEDLVQSKFDKSTEVEYENNSAGATSDPPLLQRSPDEDPSIASVRAEANAALIQARSGRTSELPYREKMEDAFSVDFSNVETHIGAEAQEACARVQAKAFTVKNVVVFSEKNPSETTVAHELTHVIQQGGNRSEISSEQMTEPLSMVSSQDRSEHEADRVAQQHTPTERGRPPIESHHNISSHSMALQRWESGLPDGSISFDTNADPSIDAVESITGQFLSGSLTDHKVRTGGYTENLMEIPFHAYEEISRGEVTISGAEGPDRDAGTRETTAQTGAVELPSEGIPVAEVDPQEQQSPGSRLGETVRDDVSRAREMENLQVNLPVASRSSASENQDAQNNEVEVRNRINRLSTGYEREIVPPPLPELDLSGDADPARINNEQAALDARVFELSNLDSDRIQQDRGENDIAPDRQLPDINNGQHQFQYPEQAQSGREVYEQALADEGLTPEQFDFTQNVDSIAGHLQNGAGDLEDQISELRSSHDSELESLEGDAQLRIDESIAQASQREEQIHQQVELQVADARTQWQGEHDAALAQHHEEVEQRVAEAGEQIATEQQQLQIDISEAVDSAVDEAEVEREHAEQRAEQERERAQQQGEEGGFWSWVGSALDTVISAITTVISAIFDALNWVIDQIFRALEWVVEQLVELVRFVVVGIIRLLREGLSLLGDALEALFGEQARKWVDAIVGFLDGAIEVLNAIYDWIRDALVGVIEFINQGLQAVITLVKWNAIILSMLLTGLWIRYLWLAIEHFDRLWNNIWQSFDGLGETILERAGPAWEEFWNNFWTPGNQLLLAIGIIVFIAGLFVGVSEVVVIIMLILAVLYLATVAVHVGENFLQYCEQIWNDDVAGARQTLADTLLFLMFNLPLILLALFGIRAGIRALSGRGGAGGVRTGEGAEGVRTGEGAEGVRTGEGAEGVRTGEGSEGVRTGEGAESGRGECFVAGTQVHTKAGPKAIESIQIGDVVWALEMGAVNQRVSATVTHTFVRHVERIVEVDVAGETLAVSATHPFWVPRRGWIQVAELEVGTPLLCKDGSEPLITGIRVNNGRFEVYNIAVDDPHDYFVGHSALLVHNKAMRWMLQDRAAALQERLAEIIERGEALPGDAPGRGEILEQARTLRPEAERLTEAGRQAGDQAALEGERAAIEGMEERLAGLDQRIEIAELPSQIASLEAEVRALEHRARSMPDSNPNKFELVREAEALRGDIESLRELSGEGADPALVDEAWSLSRRLAELEERLSESEPRPVADPWQERLDRAEWSDHGRKHMKATTEQEARTMSEVSESGEPNPSQYLPDVNNQALELEALRNGEVIRGNPADPNGTVHVRYDAGRVIGYDGGEAVTTMRAEITSGDTYHGHPRKF
jgi:hypothetical protein